MTPSGSGFDVEQAASSDFEDALRKGFWRSVTSWITKNRNELLPFDEIRKRLPVQSQHYIGLRQVEVEHIVGSVSRYHDFDRAFLPRQTHTRDRWESIDKAHLKDVILPPIELYKIGNIYFVKDGNHRVSVARERGQAYLDAYVIEIDAPFPVDPDLELIEWVMKAEQYQFLKQTHIQEMRSKAEIQFTLPGQYEKLLEHIQVHRYFMGLNLQREILEEEATLDWYDKVYVPLVRAIRRKEVLKEFPQRTETDLYLWIIEHRWYLQEEYGREVSLDRAISDFARRFTRRPIMHRLNSLRRWWIRLGKEIRKNLKRQ
jgi:hypothetical protein